MSVNQSQTVVGIFRDRAMAQQAMEALYNAGLNQEQIHYSGSGSSGSIFEDLKNLFTGPGAGADSLANDLTNMGLSDEEARFYSDEYNKGNTIVAVKAPGRESEAMTILHQYGAYNYRAATGTTTDVEQPVAYTQQGNTYDNVEQPATYTQPEQDRTYHNGEQPASVQETPEPIQDAEEQALAERQPDVVTTEPDPRFQPTPDVAPTAVEDEAVQATPTDTTRRVLESQQAESDTAPSQAIEDQATQPIVTESVSGPQDTDRDIILPEDQPELHAQEPETLPHEPTPADIILPQDHPEIHTQETETVSQEPAANVAPYEAQTDVVAPTPEVVPHETSTDLATDEPDVAVTPHEPTANVATYESDTDSTAPATDLTTHQPSPEAVTPPQSAPGTVAPEYQDEFQQLQAQVQDIQRQIQEAKTQLQAAKEQEGQLKTSHERKRQIQELKQQLEDHRAELQAILAELQEVQARIAQYQ